MGFAAAASPALTGASAATGVTLSASGIGSVTGAERVQAMRKMVISTPAVAFKEYDMALEYKNHTVGQSAPQLPRPQRLLNNGKRRRP